LTTADEHYHDHDVNENDHDHDDHNHDDDAVDNVEMKQPKRREI
jgi:hypothetical protein